MKPSKFNVYIPIDTENQYLIFNTLTGSILKVDKEAKNAIVNSEIKDIDNSNVNYLRSEGIIIDDNIDELRILKVKRNIAIYESLTAYFTIIANYSCNLDCIYCYEKYFFNKNGVNPTKKINENTSKNIIKFIQNIVLEKNYKRVIISFYGGEPLTNISKCVRIVKILDKWTRKRHIKLKVHFVSNGTLITSNIIKNLLPYNTTFQITLAGPKEIHNNKRFYKNKSGTFEDIMKGLKILINQKIPVLIRIDLDLENYLQIEKLLKDLNSRFGKGLSIRFASIIPNAGSNCVYANMCIGEKELSEIPNLWKKANQLGFKVIFQPMIKYVYCKYLTNHAYILDPYENIYKCEGFVGLTEHRVGTFDKNGFSHLNSQYYNWLSIDPLIKENCKNCSILPICGGGCPCLAFDKYNSYYEVECDSIKSLIKQKIKFIIKNMKLIQNN